MQDIALRLHWKKEQKEKMKTQSWGIICQASASQIGESCDLFKLCTVVISSEAQVWVVTPTDWSESILRVFWWYINVSQNIIPQVWS